jgi:hypothetical protein
MPIVFDDIAKLAQQCISAGPVIVLGTGASIPYGVGGMDSLRKHLVDELSKSLLATEMTTQKFITLLTQKDLEQALNEMRLPEKHEQEIIRMAWQKVHADDCQLFSAIVTKTERPHLEKLFRHLFSSTNRQIHVVTTNYDRLAEYSVNLAGYGFTNGFAEGYIGTRSVEMPSRVCRYKCNQPDRSRVVHIWKVHGSVDWFSDHSGNVFCFPIIPNDMNSFEPVIVTPGTSKYERTHSEPFRTVIGEADRALSNASSFICIGYGFNDAHIHPKLTEQARNNNKPVVILAKKLTDAAKETLKLLGECSYLAIEEGKINTLSRIYTSNIPDGEEFNYGNLWDLNMFLEAFILPKRS